MRLLIPMTAMALLVGTQACSNKSLHPSFGQLYRDVNMAQLSAHPAHDVTVRGIEVNNVVSRHDLQLAPQQGSGGGSIGRASTSTAGIPSLH